jgi:hypothetical protein
MNILIVSIGLSFLAALIWAIINFEDIFRAGLDRAYNPAEHGNEESYDHRKPNPDRGIR